MPADGERSRKRALRPPDREAYSPQPRKFTRRPSPSPGPVTHTGGQGTASSGNASSRHSCFLPSSKGATPGRRAEEAEILGKPHPEWPTQHPQGKLGPRADRKATASDLQQWSFLCHLLGVSCAPGPGGLRASWPAKNTINPWKTR